MKSKSKKIFKAVLLSMALLLVMACNQQSGSRTRSLSTMPDKDAASSTTSLAAELANKYTSVTLNPDLSQLSDGEKRMIPILIEVADIMDELFWLQAFGEKEPFLNGIQDAGTREFARINYGPWDRLDGNKSFLADHRPKNSGAQFYPADITKEELKAAGDPSLLDLYTLVRRAEDGSLSSISYHEAYKDKVALAAEKLKQAAELAEDMGLKHYLQLRADALLSDNYFESDMAWLDMKTNGIDMVVGPIEVYEDELMGYKAAYEAYVLVKDKSWSERLAKFAALLPDLQRGLPVSDAYKQETPGTDSDLNAYDVIYYAGHCNAGSKTIAINLPNDEKVQLAKGTRRLQLKNAMRAKFDKILLPLADVLIAVEQRGHITFDAFFANTMFHEVAHGLGIKNTINGKGTVGEALSDQYSALEEGKADVLGLYMITELLKKGAITGDIKDHYVTFLASIFRSIRFGSASAHGRANLLRFNFFKEMEAFSRDEATGTYRVNFDKIEKAVAALSEKILVLQGDGDYEGVTSLMAEKGNEGEQLREDLNRLQEASIPTDIVFEQGVRVLGL